MTTARHVLLVALLAYVAVDLSWPLLQGAFSFEPDDCVDGVSRSSDRIETPAVGPEVAGSSVARSVASVPMPCAPARPARPAFHRARDHAEALIAPLPAEDH